MFRRGWILGLIALFIGAMIFSGVRNSRQATAEAWQAGYTAGVLAAQSSDSNAAPLPPSAYYSYNAAYGGPRDSGFGFIFPLIFFGLTFFAFSRLMRFWAWRKFGRGGPGWGRGPWGGPGFDGPSPPPWARGGWHGHEHGPWHHDERYERGPWGRHSDGPPWRREAPTRKRPVDQGPLGEDEVI